MRALLERGGKFSRLAEDDATVPFGVLDVLALFLVGRLGCQGESGKAAVVVGANFGIAAEESDESDSVLVHGGDLRFVEFPVSCSGHPSRSERVGPAPKRQGGLSWRGPEEVCLAVFARAFQTCSGRSRESRATPCRGAQDMPRSVTPSKGRDT